MKRSKVEYLLDELCVDYGFCLSPEKYHHLASSPPDSIDAFTDAVFVAEGLDPQFSDRQTWRAVRDRVRKYFEAKGTDDPLEEI